MKKLVSLILALALSLSLAVPALAVEEDQAEQAAWELYYLGLFRGTGNGYALDKTATRMQGLIMLIRLLGEDGESKETVKAVLLFVLENLLKLLHPFMPFLTEQVYKYLPDSEGFLMLQSWPEYRADYVFNEDEQKMQGVAVIYVGEDLDVLLELCDRILVLCGGKVSGIVDARTTTKEEVGMLMTNLPEKEEEAQ